VPVVEAEPTSEEPTSEEPAPVEVPVRVERQTETAATATPVPHLTDAEGPGPVPHLADSGVAGPAPGPPSEPLLDDGSTP
jgi:hypothetical protein